MANQEALDSASRAADLQRAARAYQRANDVAKRKRSDLHEAIVEAVLLLGMTKSEAARISGYTREYVTKLCDERLSSGS